MKAKPNILIFMTDHQRGDTLAPDSSCITPNIDRFRTRAVDFVSASCPAPHCCPSRATFFTGLYPSQHGVWNNVDVDNTLSRGLHDSVRTWSEDLRDAGYRLYFSGKWHVSACESPAERGFELLHHTHTYKEYSHRPYTAEWARYYHTRIDEVDDPRGEGEVIRPGYRRYRQYGFDEKPFGDQDVVTAAVEKLGELSDEAEPWLLFIGPLGPHDPYVVPQRFYDLYSDVKLDLPLSAGDRMTDKPALYRRTQARYAQLEEREQLESLRHYLAFCSYEDYLFGQLLDSLDKAGHTEDTLVLYCSDHGDYAGAHGLWAKGLPCFREAYDICFMLGGPGIVRPGRSSEAFVGLHDWAPTILDICGIDAGRSFPGRSLVPILRDEEDNEPDHVFTQTNGNEIYGIQRAVWNRRWKYVFNSFDYDELYDLEADPHELVNLLHDSDPLTGPYAEIVRELCAAMWRFAHAMDDSIANDYIMTALAPFGPGVAL